jgi:hypothetical protein
VSKRKFLKDAKHEPFRIPAPKKISTPSSGRYDEIQMEEGEEQ